MIGSKVLLIMAPVVQSIVSLTKSLDLTVLTKSIVVLVFLLKTVRSFTFFGKKMAVFTYNMFENLTTHYLTASLTLNNRALIFLYLVF